MASLAKKESPSIDLKLLALGGIGALVVGSGLVYLATRSSPDTNFPFMTADECRFIHSRTQLIQKKGEIELIPRRQKEEILKSLFLCPKESSRLLQKFNTEGVKYWKRRIDHRGKNKAQYEWFFICYFLNLYMLKVNTLEVPSSFGIAQIGLGTVQGFSEEDAERESQEVQNHEGVPGQHQNRPRSPNGFEPNVKSVHGAVPRNSGPGAGEPRRKRVSPSGLEPS